MLNWGRSPAQKQGRRPENQVGGQDTAAGNRRIEIHGAFFSLKNSGHRVAEMTKKGFRTRKPFFFIEV